ncbi:hypothetical protein [Chryseobacterium hagamense]|uniref:Uncharacterized protein n=1 Tax=Chryseobacterium hagamense TaxID=395935 RepID=A0A511YM29_9FLAO|nr:hypothetical protein [Chryseobacterium hagamense]GEN76255.1 hypothetical protein CHA01nite_19950 [Chryseobacterium hagamense]
MENKNIAKAVLFCLLAISQAAFSQVSLSRNKLIKDGQPYKASQYKEVFQNEQALMYYKKYRTNNTVSQIFGALGGGCMGYGLVKVLDGGEKLVSVDQYGVAHTEKTKNEGWSMVGIGAGLVAIAIPFAISSKKNLNKAIDTENGKEIAFQPYFKLENAGTGLALSYNF